MTELQSQGSYTEANPAMATIHIVDDEPMVRHSLQDLFASEGWRVRVYKDGSEFLSSLTNNHLGCVVLDIKLPGMDGMAVYSEMKRREMNLPVLLYTGFGTVRDATLAMKNGAADFLEKCDGPQQLIESIRNAIDQHGHQMCRLKQVKQIQSMIQTLTPRESEVLALVMEGQTSREIATALHRSEKTIQLHRANIMKKFNVRRVVDLINLVLGVQDSDRL